MDNDIKSKTFCILPFLHLQVKPSGQYKPCCRFDFHHEKYLNADKSYTIDQYNVSEKSMNATFYSDFWNDIRNKMLNDEEITGCHKCYKEEEKNGPTSMRNYENRLRIHDNIENYINDKKIRYVEMTFGNYCNLKCRTCCSDLSSTWYEDDKKLFETGYYPNRLSYPKTVNVPYNWNPDDFEYVEEIKFTGGEPMIHPDFLKFCDMLIKNNLAQNIVLEIFTNCSWVPGDKFIKRLSKFKLVKISLSIDGIGKINDYIRFPSDWVIVEESAKKWLAIEKKHPTTYQIIWNPTINIYNICSLHEMLLWWFEVNKSFDKDWLINIMIGNVDYGKAVIPSAKIKINNLVFPEYLQINLLPDDKKEEVVSNIKNFLNGVVDAESSYLNDYINIDFMKKMHGAIKHSFFNFEEKKKWMLLVKTHPEWLDLKLLSTKTPDNRNATRVHWTIYDIHSKLNKVINNLEQPDNKNKGKNIEYFLNYTYDLDKLRNNKFKESIPDLYNCFQNYDFKGVI